MSAKKAKKTREHYHHGDLRNALLEAAGDLLKEVNPAELSLRDVARRAQVSHMAPYRHFENRTALLAALAVEGFMRLRDEMHAAVAEYPDDPARQLSSAGVRYVRLATESPARIQLMFGGVLGRADYTDEQCARTDEAFEGLHAIIVAGQSAGVFRDGDSMALALSAWSLVHGLAMLMTTGHLDQLSASAEQREGLAWTVTEMFESGILKRT